MFLLGEQLFNNVKSTFVLIALIEYIVLMQRFDAPLCQNSHFPNCIGAVYF